MLVFPATTRGRVQVVDLSTKGLEHGSVHPKTCDAHEHEVACLAINQQGTLVASASSAVSDNNAAINLQNKMLQSACLSSLLSY